MKVKIISDGTAMGTSVVDADTGEPVEDVHAVSFEVVAGRVPVVNLMIIRPEVDVIGEVPGDEQGDATGGEV